MYELSGIECEKISGGIALQEGVQCLAAIEKANPILFWYTAIAIVSILVTTGAYLFLSD